MGIGDAELLCVLLRVGALGHRQRQACAVFKRRVFDAQHAVRQGYRAQRAVSGEGAGADSRQPLFDDDGRQSRAVAKGAVAKALHGFGNAKRDHIRAARKRFAFDVQHAVGDGDVSARVPPVQCLRANRAAQQHKAQQSRPKSLHGISPSHIQAFLQAIILRAFAFVTSFCSMKKYSRRKPRGLLRLSVSVSRITSSNASGSARRIPCEREPVRRARLRWPYAERRSRSAVPCWYR